MCALPSHYMKVSPTRYGYRLSANYKRSDGNYRYTKDPLEDDFETLSYGSDYNSESPSNFTSIDNPNDTANDVSQDTKNAEYNKDQYIPVEYISLDEETMRTYYDEKYYYHSRKSDVEEINAIKKIPCNLLFNFCVIRKFAVVVIDAMIYNLVSDFNYLHNSYDIEETKSEDKKSDEKELSLMLTLRIMEYTNANCAEYYTMVRHRDEPNEFETNFLLKNIEEKNCSGFKKQDNKKQPSTNTEPNLETYDLFIVSSEIKNFNKIHGSAQKHLDKPVTIYFTPEKNSDYVSFRLRNHFKTYILLDLRKNLLYIKSENNTAVCEHSFPTKIYHKKIEKY